MNITRKLSLAVLTIGIAISAAGCSFAPDASVMSSPSMASVNATSEVTSKKPDTTISAAADAHLPVVKSKVETIASPPAAPEAPVVEPVAAAPVPVPTPVIAPPAPPVPAPAKVVPAPAPAPVVAAPAIKAAPAVSREVYVGLAGGQSVVDLQRGPVLFTLPAGFPPYVAEHDIAGGWARFGTLSAGMTVRMSGLVTGTYTVGQIINVPKHSNTDEFSKFNVMPKVLLQTCVPGTNRMIVVGLY